jgi:hypothetical protein
VDLIWPPPLTWINGTGPTPLFRLAGILMRNDPSLGGAGAVIRHAAGHDAQGNARSLNPFLK